MRSYGTQLNSKPFSTRDLFRRNKGSFEKIIADKHILD